MSLTLILIRHCKSDWTTGITADRDRPLNARGRHAAPRIGVWLAENGLTPDEVLCSDARRTRETWAGIADQLPQKPQVTYSRDLYHADPAGMLAEIRAATGPTLAVIGHNPGIGMLAWELAETPSDNPKFGFYPTGATTVLDFPGNSWSDITQGALRAFVIPRELPE